MNKKRYRNKTRDAPAPTQRRSDTSWLCSVDAYNILCGSGYTRLIDCPEVRMCAHVYADLISSMTLYLMQNTAKGDKRVINGLADKLDIEPNSLMTRKTFMHNLVSVLMLAGDGNQITYPHYTADGYLENLEPLKPSGVSILEDPRDGYHIQYYGQTFRPDEVLHFVINPDPEYPWKGTGYRAVLKDVIRGLKQAGVTKQALLESPAPSIIVKVDSQSEELASSAGRQKLGEQYLSDKENGRPWFIPADLFDVKEVKPLTLNDLALAKNMELDKRTVAGIFGVPPFMVGVGDFNAAEFNFFVTSRVMPLARGIEQEMTRKLIIATDMYLRFNPRSLYSYSLSDIITAGKEMVTQAAMDRNEWRDWIGMEPRDDMEELIVLENFIPAKNVGDQSKLKPAGGDSNAG